MRTGGFNHIQTQARPPLNPTGWPVRPDQMGSPTRVLVGATPQRNTAPGSPEGRPLPFHQPSNPVGIGEALQRFTMQNVRTPEIVRPADDLSRPEIDNNQLAQVFASKSIRSPLRPRLVSST